MAFLGGLFEGRDKGESLRREALDMARQAAEEIRKIPVPELGNMSLEEAVQVGMISPEQAQDYFSQISANPEMVSAQRDALREMRQRAESGLTDEDKFMLMGIQDKLASQEQARGRSLISEMAQRGTLDSGVHLAQQLSGGQQAAQAARQEAMQQGMEAARAKREAIQSAGQMAGQIRGQESQEQMQKAQARSMIDQFNALQRANASRSNLSEAQRIAERNIGARDQMENWKNIGKKQGQYGMEMQKAGALSGAMQSAAGTMMQGANAMGKTPSPFEMGMGIAQTAASVYKDVNQGRAAGAKANSGAEID